MANLLILLCKSTYQIPLFLKIRIANKIHRVEYELLPLICFNCGRFGHLKEACPHGILVKENEGVAGNVFDGINLSLEMRVLKTQERVEKENFGE